MKNKTKKDIHTKKLQRYNYEKYLEYKENVRRIKNLSEKEQALYNDQINYGYLKLGYAMMVQFYKDWKEYGDVVLRSFDPKIVEITCAALLDLDFSDVVEKWKKGRDPFKIHNGGLNRLIKDRRSMSNV